MHQILDAGDFFLFPRGKNSPLPFFALPEMTLQLPQYTCREGSGTVWLKEVWLKGHRDFHSLERFGHQCTALVDVSLSSYTMLNTRNATTEWVTRAFMQRLRKLTRQYSPPTTLLPPTGTAGSPGASTASGKKAGWTSHTSLQPPGQCLSACSTRPSAELQSHRSQSTAKKPRWPEQLANKYSPM